MASFAKREALELRRGIRAIARARRPRHADALPEQPFDLELLRASPLFRRSRRLFRAQGGEFRPTLLSSPRTLSSVALLENRIEYSPIERELLWIATDPRESAHAERLLELRGYSTSTFHEQNHRVLWRFLPPPPADRAGLRRYLNFTESLVVALDMALGDELGPRAARFFYLAGVTYDPGTTVKREGLSRREYRNYLHACAYATYLNLELYDPEEIPAVIRALFPSLGKLANRASSRALQLDRAFVLKTNPIWQRRHSREVLRAFSKRAKPPLALDVDPLRSHAHYLWTERWLEHFGL